jgi:dTDP-glucose pyrophosphorylase
MASLEVSSTGIVLLVDEAGHLRGTMTDGDIRRALLAGCSLDAAAQPHMQSRFISVPPLANRAGVLDLMRAQGVQQIPVVSLEGRLEGLHLLREMIGAVERPNWAVVMAGGEGRRLRPLTESLPKPMLRVAGRPILERIVLQLAGFGVRHIFLAINYLGHVIEEHFGDGHQLGCTIEYLREEQPLGTAGALSLLPQRPRDPVLLMNGDLITEANLGAIVDFHTQARPVATIAVRPYHHVVPFGCVTVRQGRLTGIEEKPCLTRLVNAGIYVLDPRLLERLEPSQSCTVPQLLLDSCRRGEDVQTYELDGEWADVGRPEDLRQARGQTTHA